MPGFVEQLTQLGRSNIGSQLPQAGLAIRKHKVENKIYSTLEEVRKLESEFESDGELQTIGDQIVSQNETLGKMVEAGDITEDDLSIATSGLDGTNKTQAKALQSSLNLFKIQDKVDKYRDLYAPFITSLATLGPEGVTAANALSNELAGKITSLQERSTIPAQEAAYQIDLQKINMDQLKFDELIKSIDNNEDTSAISNFIIADPVFTSLTGNNTLKTPREASEYRVKMDGVLARARAQFPEAGNLIDVGFNRARLHTGTSMDYNRYMDPKAGDAAARSVEQQMLLQAMLTDAENYSSLWDLKSDEYKTRWRAWVNNPGENTAVDQAELEQFKTDMEIFGPNGKFNKAYEYAVQNTGNYPGGGLGQLVKGEHGFMVPKNPLFENITVPGGIDKYFYGDLAYSKSTLNKIIAAQQYKLEGFGKGLFKQGNREPNSLFDGSGGVFGEHYLPPGVINFSQDRN
jgi:hypothetical protein